MPPSLPRPPGYVAPAPPRVSDVLRSLRVVVTDLVPMLWRLATRPDLDSTTTPAGLARVRAEFSRALRRLAVDLEVLHASRVPDTGGLLFMWNQESHLDHLVLPIALPRPFLSLYNNEVARTPIYGPHLRRTGHVHLDRT